MAVPTITSVTPALVHTSGATMVEIIGTGFAVPALPGITGAAQIEVATPTVTVMFGTAEALPVSIVSSTRLLMSVPATPLAVVKPDYGEGAVDVVVQNLDAGGNILAGESVTATAGLTYQRAQLAEEGILTRVVRQLIKLMRAQVIPNIVTSTHTDYDDDTTDGLNITELAKFPGIALMGPELVENRFFTVTSQTNEIDSVTGEVLSRRPAYTVDLNFDLVGVSNSKVECLNLMGVVHQFFERTKFLNLDKDPDDSTAGTNLYELDIVAGSDMKVFGRPNESNIRTFSGSFVVRGVDFEDIAGFPRDQVVARTVVRDETCIDLSVEQTGEVPQQTVALTQVAEVLASGDQIVTNGVTVIA